MSSYVYTTYYSSNLCLVMFISLHCIGFTCLQSPLFLCLLILLFACVYTQLLIFTICSHDLFVFKLLIFTFFLTVTTLLMFILLTFRTLWLCLNYFCWQYLIMFALYAWMYFWQTHQAAQICYTTLVYNH